MEISLKNSSATEFLEWSGINIDSVTWKGKNKNSFEQFCRAIFSEREFISSLELLSYLMNYSKAGPVKSWITWIRNRLLAYVFIKKNITIKELAESVNIPYKELSNILRGHFVDNYPQYEEKFSEYFLISDAFEDTVTINISAISKKAGIDLSNNSRLTENILGSLEVTLYPEWQEILLKLQELIKDDNVKELSNRPPVEHSKMRLLIEILVLSIIGLLIGTGVKFVNRYYERIIVETIQLFEPNYLQINTAISFKEPNLEASQLTDIQPDLDNVEDVFSQEEVKIVEEERVGTESDVVITSWDSLPKDFESAGLETSQYEEFSKGGFRDTRFGDRKAYRLMVKSQNTIKMRDYINNMITQYKVERGDKVAPGTFVPGGVYYNLFVPREFIKEFIAQVMDEGEAVLYESKTRGYNPPGKNKVFIWLKKI